ncbi:MAG: hypothetical protein WBP84_06425 [Nitrososphaeraceae archaeon]
MVILELIRASITAILLITTIMITITTNIQPVFAPGDCGNCGAFLKLTAQFEKAVIGATAPPEPEKIGQFRQLTGQSLMLLMRYCKVHQNLIRFLSFTKSIQTVF